MTFIGMRRDILDVSHASVTQVLFRLHVKPLVHLLMQQPIVQPIPRRGGGLGSRPKKMYGKRLGDGVEYHLMSPTPRC